MRENTGFTFHIALGKGKRLLEYWVARCVKKRKCNEAEINSRKILGEEGRSCDTIMRCRWLAHKYVVFSVPAFIVIFHPLFQI